MALTGVASLGTVDILWYPEKIILLDMLARAWYGRGGLEFFDMGYMETEDASHWEVRPPSGPIHGDEVPWLRTRNHLNTLTLRNEANFPRC